MFKKIKNLLANEEGALKDMVWVIGAGVVMVLVVVLFMTLAPDTAQDIWDTFVDYAKSMFNL